MSLRLRLALGTGCFSAVVVALFAAGAVVASADDVLGAVDEQLLARADAAVELDGAGPLGPLAPPPDERIPSGILVDDGDAIEVLGPNGQVVAGFGPAPISAADLDVAAGRLAGPVLRTEEIDGTVVRIASVHLPNTGVAIRFSRDITDVRQGLDSLRTRLLGGAVLAGLVVAVGSWWVAGRFVAPVVAVADAAEALARRQDVPERIEVRRSDEVGRLATSFNALLDALAVAREQQRRLVADASHELRTPLTSLRTRIEFLQSTPELDADRRRDVVAGAVEELERLSGLVAELVDLAADAGRGDEDPEVVDLAGLVRDEAERFRRLSGRSVAVAADRLELAVRPRAVARALSNLLRNADAYSPTDGAIEVRQQGARIEVRDHGPGIAPADRDRIFDRFYRGPTATGTDGSGIGLAIVARVAEIHGGTVWADNDPGGGAVVGFSVAPTVRAAASADL